MLRERTVQIRNDVESCEPAPGVGFSIEPDLVSRNDGSNNLRAAYPVTVRIDGEAGTKKTITGPGYHWIEGGFRRLDILGARPGSYWRCSVAEVKGDGADVVPALPTWHADPAFLGEKGFGPTPVVMLAGRLENSDSTRGQAALWRFSYEGVPCIGLSVEGAPTALRTDAMGYLLQSPTQTRPPVKLAELAYGSSSLSYATFEDGKTVFLTGIDGWTTDPSQPAMDVSGYRALIFEVNGGLNDPNATFNIAPSIRLMAGASGVNAVETIDAGAGLDWRSAEAAAVIQVGPGLEFTSTSSMATRPRIPRLVKAGWENQSNTSGGVTADRDFCARLWGVP